MARELQPHPLLMKHKNIIKTHFFMNKKSESFLVEERLPFVLDDGWRAKGVQEAANLLYDIANALAFLHSMGLVHGDVKPDNIGKDGEDYILLDFGICRKKEAFVAEVVSATGSLRTRAPELLELDKYLKEQPEKVDIWALGATVYNALVGRFPLFDKDENPPRISTPEERSKFEAVLLERVRDEWEKRVDLSLVQEPMRNLLAEALEKDPKKRCQASKLVQESPSELAAFLRASQQSIGKFSPLEELQQFKNYLPDSEILNLMPIVQKETLKTKLDGLKTAHGFDKDQLGYIDDLLKSLV
ncbi:MAG: protein kinase [Nitrospirae bacterium]|nr:protein kinase [Nitrospirota bacterium]